MPYYVLGVSAPPTAVVDTTAPQQH